MQESRIVCFNQLSVSYYAKQKQAGLGIIGQLVFIYLIKKSMVFL